MDNASKAIMIGVGLFITVIIISAVLVVVNLGTGAMNNATNQMSGVLDSLTTVSDFANVESLSRTEVQSLISKCLNETISFPVTVREADKTKCIVCTRDGGYDPSTLVNSAGSGVIAAKHGIKWMSFKTTTKTTETAATYKPLASKYKCSIIEDSLGNKLGLYIYVE